MSADGSIRVPPRGRRADEAERLATIARLGMTEIATVATFDALVHTLRMMLGVASAYVVVIGVDSLMVWSGVGEGTLTNMPRTGSFSEEVVRTGRPVVISDARHDPRFAGHPYVSRPDGSRFFVGIPLATSTGAVLGTLCGFDPAVRPHPDEETIRLLEELATTAMAELELKTTNAELAQQEVVLRNRTDVLEATFDNITEGVSIFDDELRLVAVNRRGIEILGLAPEVRENPAALDLVPVARAGFYGEGEPDEVLAAREERLRRYLDNRPQPLSPDTEITLRDGRTVRRRLRQMSEGFLTTYVDMSDLRRRQSQLLMQARYFELQLKLAVLSNSAPDLPAALGRIVDLNLRELRGDVGLVWRRRDGRLVADGIVSIADRPDLDPAEQARIAASLIRPSAMALRAAQTGRMGYASPDDGDDRGDLGRLRPADRLRTGYAAPLKILDEFYVLEFYGPGGIGRKSWHHDIINDLECQLDLVSERDRARRRKAEFISMISHELRTPLTSMRGMLELLESGLFGALPDDASGPLAEASADSRILGTLIEDVLAIHDVQHGDVPTAPARTDLGAALARAAGSAPLSLALDDDADLHGILDEALLSRALAKLAPAIGAADRPARVSARRRGAAVRILVEGAPGAGNRPAAGGSVAVRLASCLLERAGARVTDRSSPDRVALQVDVPVETVRIANSVLPAEIAMALDAAVLPPLPPPAALSAAAVGPARLQAAGP